jgi:hypothetical protein
MHSTGIQKLLFNCKRKVSVISTGTTKITCASFHIFDLPCCTINMQCLDQNPYPNFYLDSDSDPAKSFGFFRIRIRIRNNA